MPEICSWKRITRYFLVFALLSFLVSACSIGQKDMSTSGTPQATTRSASTPTATAATTPEIVTQPVPATRTDCPTRTAMRALMTAPLAMGKHPQVVYAPVPENHDPMDRSFRRDRIVRYDIIDHTSIDILKLPDDKSVFRLFTSADGQWIFFLTQDVNIRGDAIQGGNLQAIRVDGQGLQTIFCGFAYGYLSFSPDLHWLAYNGFHQGTGLSNTIHLFDLQTGTDHQLVDVPEQKPGQPLDDPHPFSWISPTLLALTGLDTHHYYVLDITGAEHRALSSLPVVTLQPYTTAIIDGPSLFLGQQQCQSGISCEHGTVLKSTITRQPAQGGTAQTIFEKTFLAITELEVLTPQTLLMSATNPSANTCEIWSINIDGSNNKQLLSELMSDTRSACQVGAAAPDGIHYLILGWATQQNPLLHGDIGATDGSDLSLLPNGGPGAFIAGWTLL